MFPAEMTIRDVCDIALGRRNNKLDFNIAVTGARGSGKSTLLFKIFVRLDGFKPKEHIVYSRPEVIQLITSQMNGYVFDDEAITSSYKREFQNTEQQELIKVLNMYRDSFNIYGICIPDFYSLDKDIRKLVKMHIHVISRGIGVIHCSKGDRIYSNDPWDIEYNQKIEQSWSKYQKFHPNWIPPYHKLSTFVGYIYFNDMTPAQRELYESIKKSKRDALYGADKDKKINSEKNKFDNLYIKYKNGEIDNKWLENYCSLENIKVTNILNNLRIRARNEGLTLKQINKDKETKEKLEKIKSGGVKVSDLV